MKSLVPKWIAQPTLPITITVIGAGATGSLFLTHLARIAYSIFHTQNKKLMVTVIDGDKIKEHNIGRQVFYENEIHLNKAEVATARINRTYGFDWIARNRHFEYKNQDDFKEIAAECGSNIIISCTDTVLSRKQIHAFVKAGAKKIKEPEWRPMFWMDIGNTKNTGNVVIGSPALNWPSVVDMYGKNMKEGKEEHSCSLALSLNEQDLFINPFCANIAAKWLWELLSQDAINWRGGFVNLDSLSMQKIKV